MPSLRTRIAGLLAAGLTTLAPGLAVADTEEPAYDVVSTHDGWELRRYAPTIEARVTVQTDYRSATYTGFRVLADYIFGGNEPRREIAMTAPVAAQPAGDGARGQEIAMTAPVAASPAPDRAGAWTVAFTMPSEWTMETLPVPTDPRVKLVEVPARTVAALEFGGWATAGRAADKQQALLAGIEAAGLAPTAAPIIAQYNPPWTPPPFRRNEVLVPVAAP